MLIFPAIDIQDGNCVRLFQGKFDTAEQVAEDSLKTAREFEAAGAQWIHMVDLDGAVAGKPQNRELFITVAKETALKVEMGGGIRDMRTVETYLTAGVSRVILGSAAVNTPEFVREAVRLYPNQVAIGIDAKNEMVAAEGWISGSSIHYIELAKRMQEMGAKTIIYTDISKDGTLEGPNFEQLLRLQRAVVCDIIASGGIKDLDDIRRLKEQGLYGAICGRSLYNKTLDLKQAILASA